MKKVLLGLVLIGSVLSSCNNQKQDFKNEVTYEKDTVVYKRVVSLNGALSEIVSYLGAEDKIVATDITSNYPEKIAQLPKVGHNRSISAEGILAQNPDAVIGIKSELKPETVQQLRAAGLKLFLFNQDYSIAGTKSLIKQVADSLNLKPKLREFNVDVDSKLKRLIPFKTKPKVLFIYARGLGTLMVAGKSTKMDKMIALAGGQNAINSFEDFKPLTAEALVNANPDAILMFNSGLGSLKGVDGMLLNVPGLSETNAGRTRSILTMDGQFLSGFGPRVADAAVELNLLLNKKMNQK